MESSDSDNKNPGALPKDMSTTDAISQSQNYCSQSSNFKSLRSDSNRKWLNMNAFGTVKMPKQYSKDSTIISNDTTETEKDPEHVIKIWTAFGDKIEYYLTHVPENVLDNTIDLRKLMQLNRTYQ
ncbi:hypothetical protein ACOME3_003046 [Neoechinorhynchus agilis]